MNFQLVSKYSPSGDQPKAIDELTKSVQSGARGQILLGVTGSGKTYTMANVIQNLQRPALILAHNKTLAAQLCSEFKDFFPHNAVEYFVSYYDYYQPEAYIPSTDTFIEKDSSINDEIDKLRHSATAALLERRDVIIVSSVSCIYGLGDPDDYKNLVISLREGMIADRNKLLEKLVEIQYERNDIDFSRGKFRARGDTVEIFPPGQSENALRVEFFGDEIERITEINVITGEIIAKRSHVSIPPNSHYATTTEKMEKAIGAIESELTLRVEELKAQDKMLEAQRITQRTKYDIEMMKETGFCQGIENYSRHISGRAPGSPPFTLIDYFPEDFLLIVDESHVTIPQVRAMFNGDRARKTTLVEYGFRLPSAFDNRPLNFEEFEAKINQVVFVSATPAEYEKNFSSSITEQIIRPTGLLDPIIDVRPVSGQVDDLYGEIQKVKGEGGRVFVTTLTKRMAEDLTDYLENLNVAVKYLHSDVKTLERMEIIRSLRLGEFDVLVGINLLREGLDVPEVKLVCILDADKEGFLRSETSLIQTIGRAARNSGGRVIMYADSVTKSMEFAIKETERRRRLQEEYNLKNGIIPQTIVKNVHDVIKITVPEKKEQPDLLLPTSPSKAAAMLKKLEAEMRLKAKNLDFEGAAVLRDKIAEIKKNYSI